MVTQQTRRLDTSSEPPIERVIGRLHSETNGPTVVAVGAIHGNEPAGRIALSNVVASLSASRGLRCGDFLALVGNVEASRRRVRYVEGDLNRHWSLGEPDLDSDTLPAEPDESGFELREREELERCVEDAFEASRGDTLLLDLHTTSGAGQPFCVFADTLRIRQFAQRLPVPLILGFEEQLSGTMIDVMARRGHLALTVEGGQHEAPSSVTHLETVIWMVLMETGLVTADEVTVPIRQRIDALRALAAKVPRALEVLHRHPVRPEDRFRMLDGFRSFQRVEEGDLLAENLDGAIHAPADGYLLMPLYQSQGDDGFFLTRRVRPVWLFVSSCLRLLRVGKVVHWLPGVEKAPSVGGSADHVLVETNVARWYSLQILHLLGFRRLRTDQSRQWFERRAHDLRREPAGGS